jgi:hypothetical protein
MEQAQSFFDRPEDMHRINASVEKPPCNSAKILDLRDFF